MHRAAVAAIGLVVALLLPGCATACPAIGWSNGVEIDASAYGSDVFLQVCSDAGCSAAPGVVPTPESEPSVPALGEAGTVHFGFAAPDEITVRVYDISGILLSESEEPIAWTHSTEPCGGPSTAPPLVLRP
ncbi:hypothetical protein [Microbacterium sp. 3J1]|uniref:hypothetical protein n=1 Tax=Microbacterium sp. 3J1 TaxID=861269 RepID=UPI000AB2CA43|nr:hypothetical protein [Microbacterium sp. 3J1]